MQVRPSAGTRPWSEAVTPVEKPAASRLARCTAQSRIMIYPERMGVLASSLTTDGCHMQIPGDGNRVLVTIAAIPVAFAHCLMPRDVMWGTLRRPLVVPEDAIDLACPRDAAP